MTLRVVHYVFNPDHYIGIVIANTTLILLLCWLLYVDNIYWELLQERRWSWKYENI